MAQSSGVNTTFRFDELAGSRRAVQLREIGRLKEALLECDKVLGSTKSETSNLMLLLKGEYDFKAFHKAGKHDYQIKAPAQLIGQTIELKMAIYIDLIENGDDAEYHTNELIKLTNLIQSFNMISSGVELMCAQAYLKALKFDRAIAISKRLLRQESDNARSWWVLIVALNMKPDHGVRDQLIFDKLLPTLSGKNEHHAQRVCGKSCIITQQWESAIKFFLKAYEINNNDIECLHDACACSLNSDRIELARKIYFTLIEVAPRSIYAQKLSKHFA